MAEKMEYLVLEGTEYEVVDGAAREALAKLSADVVITRIESDASNPVALRDLESGVYLLYGKFIAFTGSTSILGFSSSLLVNIVRGSAKSSLQIFYPTNNCVQFLEITDESFERTNVYMNQLVEHIGTMSDLQTGEKGSLVAAVNELAAVSAGIQSQIDDLNYKAITISSFTNNVGTVEMGTIVTDVTLAWKFSKKAKSVTLDGEEQAADSTGAALKGLSITSNKTWTLKVTDERDTAATKTTAVSFVNGVYYGVGAAQDAYDSAFILGLTKTLRGSKLTSVTVTAGEGQYIFYCLPTRYGKCTFTVGGFTGGFDLVATVPFTNASGYTENYYVYKSVNANLGNTTVSIA